MVLLIAHKDHSLSIENIIDWLDYFKTPWERISGEALIDNNFFYKINKDKTILKLDESTIETDNISHVFYWRWGDFEPYIKSALSPLNSLINCNTYYSLFDFIEREIYTSYIFLTTLYNKAHWLSHPSTSIPNKLKVLSLASELQLNIPDTIVTSSKKELQNFLAVYEEVIIKPLSDCPVIQSNGELFYMMYTTKIDSTELKNFPKKFLPSLFQELINKKFEIRSFYINKKFYSMAIFSQKNLKTKIDFRKYDRQLPNRTVPYQLPVEIENKLAKLMEILNLNTGSIDLLKDINGQYYFLEINPVGQFGMVSFPCNYFLEREIALALTKKIE